MMSAPDASEILSLLHCVWGRESNANAVVSPHPLPYHFHFGPQSGSGESVNVDLGSGVNEFTYKKLFHLLSGNCFITSCLLMENSVGRSPKFVRAFAFGQTVLLLIYALSSVQWYPWLQKFLTWSHNQHSPRRTALP